MNRLILILCCCLLEKTLVITTNLTNPESAPEELFGSKAGDQILQIHKKLNVLHIFIYFGYFFKFMYSYHQMIGTFMEIDKEAANPWCSKK